jgi:HEPN domain-containing protein
VEFPKTHDLGELLDLLATADAALAQQLRAAEGLNPYAVDTRYPGDCPEMTVQDGRQAVALATQVKEQVFLRLGAYLQGPSDR